MLAAAWLWWPRQSDSPPSITVLAPAGGETWEPGEEHTIAWGTRGIDPDDKISITIRRIPPPPLQEDGQEFDPIVFIDLSNTGSVTWKLSSMYPDGTYVLELHAYESLPITGAVSAESAPFTILHPKLHTDLYPLYGGVEWDVPEAETVTVGAAAYEGASVSSFAIPAGMDPASIFMPFERYYENKLQASGWTVANDLAAGGHVGGQTGYRKGESIMLTRFHIEYHTAPADAPSECPCDVTLSLFSTER